MICRSLPAVGPSSQARTRRRPTSAISPGSWVPAGLGVGPFGVQPAASVVSWGYPDEALATAAVAALDDGPANHGRVGPVVASDHPERRPRGAVARARPPGALRAQLVGLRIERGVP